MGIEELNLLPQAHWLGYIVSIHAGNIFPPRLFQSQIQTVNQVESLRDDSKS